MSYQPEVFKRSAVVSVFLMAVLIMAGAPMASAEKASDTDITTDTGSDSWEYTEKSDHLRTADPIAEDPSTYAGGDEDFERYMYQNPRRERTSLYTRRSRPENKLTSFEFGPEAYYHRYAEPNLMRNKGYMYGAFAEYTYRTNWNYHVRSVADAFQDGNKINMYRLETRMAFGEVDYESEGTGKDDGIKDFNFEIRGLMGYDFPLSDDSTTRMTPILGLGYRYLRDNSGGRQTTTGHFGYDRESNYFYLPVGLEFHTECPKGWFLELAGEYDVFLGGTQKSHLEDVSSGFGTLENDQDDGWGVRGSIKFGKKTENVDFFVEPFWRYWEIEDSELSPLVFSGAVVGAGLEPENNTREYGVKAGMQF